jgi:hypothetical protein
MSSPKLAECPLCGYSAGVYIVAKSDSAVTPVRCLFCRGQAPLDRWLKSSKPRSDRSRLDPRA